MKAIVRQLFDHESWTFTYLLADPASGDAVMIDPVLEQHARDTSLLRELGVRLVYTMETHVHADHVTGAALLRAHTGCEVVVSKHTGIRGADVLVDDGDEVRWGSLALQVRSTPGHSSGCATYVTPALDMAFTGDALLIRGAGRTDMQGGDPRALYRSVREKIFTLPSECLLYPAHDYHGRTVTTVREERLFNPRLAEAVREEDFVGYMQNLGLPHPRRIDVAVPANLRCGSLEGQPVDRETPKWGPVVRSHAGVWEVNPQWVAEHQARLRILDVRTPAEFDGELGHLRGAILLPLDELPARLGELAGDLPVIVVCQSGARSARGAQLLETAGLSRVANLSGGMLRWSQLGLPVDGAQDAGDVRSPR